MRKLFGFVLVALSGCDARSPRPAPPTVTVPSAPPRAEPPQAPLDAVPPEKPDGPLVIIGSEHVTLGGKVVGSVREIHGAAKFRKIDPLFEALKAERIAWRAAHEGEPFPGIASLVVAPGTSGVMFGSVFQTIAFGGFPHIHVAVNGRYYPTSVRVPGPPCGMSAIPCTPPPPHPVLHVQADEQGWRLRVPREGGPLDASGEGPRSSVESFRAAVSGVVSTAGVGAIVLHVARNAPFSRLAPFLAEIVDLSERARLAEGVTVSIREIDAVSGVPRAAFPP